jgi:DNA-binding MarR family transcriptional regulator
MVHPTRLSDRLLEQLSGLCPSRNTMNKEKPDGIDVLLSYQTQRLQDLIVQIVQCRKEQASSLSKICGIPEAELRCLMLFGAERYITVKGSSQKLNVAKSRVTKIVSGLMQKELVETIDDPNDARIKLVFLTREGRRKVGEMEGRTTELHQKLLLEFHSEQRKTILSCLEMLRSGMETLRKPVF